MACTSTLTGHGSWVYGVTFSPRREQLASASADHAVGLWSVETGECYGAFIGHEAGVFSVANSHNGDLLASGSFDKTLRLWDVATGQCRAVVRNFQGGVTGITWIPSDDGNYLVTGCEDGSVLKWQVIEEEEQCHVKLCWTAANGSFTVKGASIQDVRGLASLHKQLLKQRGAVGEPENLFRETGKKLATMTSVVSQLKQLSVRTDEQSQRHMQGGWRGGLLLGLQALGLGVWLGLWQGLWQGVWQGGWLDVWLGGWQGGWQGEWQSEWKTEWYDERQPGQNVGLLEY
jgi:hypothetical protein